MDENQDVSVMGYSFVDEAPVSWFRVKSRHGGYGPAR